MTDAVKILEAHRSSLSKAIAENRAYRGNRVAEICLSPITGQMLRYLLAVERDLKTARSMQAGGIEPSHLADYWGQNDRGRSVDDLVRTSEFHRSDRAAEMLESFRVSERKPGADANSARSAS